MLYFISVIAFIFILVMLVSIFVGWKLIHPPDRPVIDNPKNYGLNYENISFKSRGNDITLKGWYIPAEKNEKMTLIFGHGYLANREEPRAEALKLVKTLVSDGYNVLMFDFRAWGESEGKMCTLGLYEKYDMQGAIDWVKQNKPESRIGLFGFSMGAATSLLVAAEENCVEVVVADSPFSDLKAYLNENLSYFTKLPKYPFNPIILNTIPFLSGVKLDVVKPIDVIGKIYPRKVLFIHSDADKTIFCRHSELLSNCHPDKFTYWKTSGVLHLRSHQAYPNEYQEKVLSFLNSAVN
ncbi:alpha/beta hydrolase [Peribacillus butanolivorans]|uniref:alpha/beta hydrolase n=1 Tax=Peribacillus butanolivorans TaxID=421767 RepID=UPI00364CCBEE